MGWRSYWKKVAGWVSVIGTISTAVVVFANQLPPKVGAAVMLACGIISAVLPNILKRIEQIEEEYPDNGGQGAGPSKV